MVMSFKQYAAYGSIGGLMVLVFLLVATGLLLKFAYQPSPALAYDSILYLETQIPFGQLLRNLHRWSGNALIFISFLHLLRVFYTGAFTAPRQVNWIFGLLLFFLMKKRPGAKQISSGEIRYNRGLPVLPFESCFER